MMRISILKTALQKSILSLFFIFLVGFSARADVGLSVITNESGNDVTADVHVYNWTEIISAQFTLTWDPTSLEFVEVSDIYLPSATTGSFGTQNTSAGYITFSWFEQNLNGVTLPNCDLIFSITFTKTGATVPPILLSGNPTPIEVVNVDQDVVPLTQNLGCADVGQISGNVFNDLDDDCLFDLGETGLEDWTIEIETNGYTFYKSTNSNGDYHINLLPGQYDISLILPQNNLWNTCQATQAIDLQPNGSESADFPAQSIIDCPAMTVDLSTPFLRRCFTNNYYIFYCNDGTITAEDAYVEVEFDSYLNVQSSSIPWSSVNGDTYTFPLGDIAVNECGSFFVEVEVSCDATLGQTHCSNAHIFPDSLCIPTSPLWDGSNLEIISTCDGDSVRFEILNTGDDMEEAIEFIVIEDDMVLMTGDPIQLSNQQSVSVAFEANGSTWRLEMDENPHNPLETFVSESVEGCGTNGNGTFSIGFVNQFPLDDENPSIDEDCQENRGAFDPNDKTGYPNGFCAAHYIRAEQDIEYRIRFQNTGTDTAFNIIIRDTLSNFLDPASVRPGSSSHPYDFELLGNGVVQFAFPNIMLPDSNVNEPASHGFVKFSVEQRPGTPMGAQIKNQANIVFDFNEPIYTNTYTHTIGDEFVEMAGLSGDLSVSGNVTTWYNEPVENAELTMTNLCPVLTDADGNYLFENKDTADYVLMASKYNDDPREGVTVLDLVKTREFILGFEPLSFHQMLAADANLSASTTTFDMVIYRKLILGMSIGQELDWIFVTPNYVSTYQYNPLNSDLMNQDFIAVKPGNIITEDMVEQSSINTEFYLEPAGTEPGVIRIDVKAKNFTTVNGFQFGLEWDQDVLEYAAVEASQDLPNITSSIFSPEPGILNVAWIFSSAGLTLDDETTLFTLVFNTVAPMGAQTPITFDDTEIPFQTVVDDCKLTGGSHTGTNVTIDNPNAAIEFEDLDLAVQIAPNPIPQGQPLSLQIESGSNRSLTVEIYDLNGKITAVNRLQIPAGRSNHLLVTMPQKGIFFINVREETGAEMTGKVMVY